MLGSHSACGVGARIEHVACKADTQPLSIPEPADIFCCLLYYANLATNLFYSFFLFIDPVFMVIFNDYIGLSA